MVRTKRLAMPKIIKIPRKINKWAPTTRPGPHPKEASIPLIIAIRDILRLADTAKEAKRIIVNREIYVDGRCITDYRFPIGFMDVVSIPKINKHFRVLYDVKGNLRLVEIPAENSNWKLVRIENKTRVKEGKIQLNLHDGRNILLEKNMYKTGDVLKIEVPSQKIMAHYPLEKGSIAMIIGGKHRGMLAKIKDYVVTRSPKPNIVRFEEGFETTKDNVFVVGVVKPEITLPEVKAYE